MSPPEPNGSIDPALARLIVESSTDFAIYTTDRNGLVTSWNPGAEKLIVRPAQDALGMDSRSIFTPEDRTAGVPDNEMARALKEGRSVNERWHIRADGSRFWASGLLMPLRDGEGAEPHGFVKIMRDRTVEREADRRFSAMTAALPGFVFVTDADGSNVETNEQYQVYTGRSAAELTGDGWYLSLHPDDRERATDNWSRAVQTGKIYEASYRFRRHDHVYRSFACRAVPERDSEGRILRWLGTCLDVENEARARAALEDLNRTLEHRATQSDADLATAIETLRIEVAERQRTEDALRQAQKMEAVGQLTGGVAHDFNNLLTVIRSSIDLLRRADLSDERRARYMDAISETVDRAAGVTRQLLAFARRQPLQPEKFDPAARLKEMASMLTSTLGARVALTVETDGNACLIQADPNQFDTAVLNLVINARDAMNGEGALTLRVEQVESLPARRGHLANSGRYTAISVTDSGTGIPADQRDRIFEPFFTTKDVGKGTGLGLSQVIGFAKQSGGDVTLASVLGEGTTFTFYLPRVTGVQRHHPEPVGLIEQRQGGRGSILLVEDNETVGQFAEQLLEDLGYETCWAPNAHAALDLICEAPGRFDLVFSDVVMPGMSGIDLARRLREGHPNIPVVLASGYSDILAAEGTHGFPLLHKPYSVDTLSSAISKALGR
ncbi:PAS domain-containing sensor histidine kinase [Novosphingobium sp. 9U]|uniref:hybrid sensor histidine kinase/response regulator n=1 Tax=Novosphingobium sp. 9U TaxID=2653158 RepID=UPI0012F3C749|nr:hybrid sensor histidine kinase/response regulator [Novosphingobium sp. 9U]VWX48024.1 Histidine kinase [Novosphingobium sp. 9U]